MKLQEWMQCARKICHTDFLSAYMHKRGLLKLNPYAEIDIYPCDFCGGLHVGNQLTVPEAKRSVKTLLRMMRHPNFEKKVSQETQDMLNERLHRMESFLKYESQSRATRGY